MDSDTFFQETLAAWAMAAETPSAHSISVFQTCKQVGNSVIVRLNPYQNPWHTLNQPQDQVGWVFKQPVLVADVSARGKSAGTG